MESEINISPNNGSDFDPVHFTPEENERWANLLGRMRAFELAVCRQFRTIENAFSQISSQIQIQNTADRVRELESSIKELENFTEMDTFETKEKLIEVEEEIGKVSNSVERNETFTRIRFEKIVEKIKEEVRKISENLDVLKGRVQLLEFEQDNPEVFGEWFDDGQSQEHNRLPDDKEATEGEDNIQTGDGSCEIMVADPFLGGITPLEGYDGNPSVSFSRWVARFEDMLTLYPQYSEVQKLSRLRILLSGQARAEFDSIEPSPVSLSDALNHLKRKFENENTRSIARQAMASCRQAPGERVYEFANRLNEAVRTALSGENEETIRKRLLEEFLEKLTSELQFEVKAGRPMSYSNAYEIAQHFELLLATKRTNQVSVADSVAELSHKVEALAIHQHSVPKRGTERRVCYYCRRPGHVVRNCRDKKRDEERRGHGGQRDRPFYGERKWNYERNEREHRHRHFSPHDRPNYGGNEREHRQRHFSPHNRPSHGRNNYRSPVSYEKREYENERTQSPGRRVRFGGQRIGAARIASPIFLALMVILSLFGANFALNSVESPMICHPDSPATLWSIPIDPICPSWTPTELPVAMKLNVYRVNTVKYKTKATAWEFKFGREGQRRENLGKNNHSNSRLSHYSVPKVKGKGVRVATPDDFSLKHEHLQTFLPSGHCYWVGLFVTSIRPEARMENQIGRTGRKDQPMHQQTKAARGIGRRREKSAKFGADKADDGQQSKRRSRWT
ncbi:hypothetical protein niasHT_007163 [Heterodera trifolii]|uniref:CCHC-type domain-containing protein n=1 Tax=Heterodera trifolii TaxID=157864 RepID=A0ABD2LKU9_9BILA